MTVRRTKQADRDIIAIYRRGVTEFGVTQAERYHAGLSALFELLAANPRIARERIELSPPVRLHPYGAHLVAYIEHGGGILIVRVLHGRQDWELRLS